MSRTYTQSVRTRENKHDSEFDRELQRLEEGERLAREVDSEYEAFMNPKKPKKAKKTQFETDTKRYSNEAQEHNILKKNNKDSLGIQFNKKDKKYNWETADNFVDEVAMARYSYNRFMHRYDTIFED